MRPQAPPKSDLTAFLKREDSALYGKVAELRAEVTRWLTYVPSTFSHYTSHTVDHSDEIVLQISKLLFEPKKRNPVVDLGPVGAYLLIASAYLHDAGMVSSDSDKAPLLASAEWRDWVSNGSGASRWREVEDLRRAAGDEPLKHFAADRATRFLIAEFIRKQHHRRAGELVRGRSMELGRIDLNEPSIRDAIAEICVAHGLDSRELEDDIRFPEARDILGERVNVRLLATLLRLGDLLDLRYDRACPLLLQAACPLPSDSYAHWTQYGAIKHRLTCTDRIEIRAECCSHDEHRNLHDWCSWVVKEVASLPARHPGNGWCFPVALMTGERPTIQVGPARDASYIPGTWTFELDQDAVFQRLIADAYDSPNVFVRELIQNALDATRCRMYKDLRVVGSRTPEFPTEVEEAVRQRLPVRASLHEEEVTNDLSGEHETVQVLTVEDCGIGMDLEVIQRYLLQVGRSYYTTAEFRREYPFHPTSRFGIGFLSVFAVSDHVTVETYSPSKPLDGPLRLVLTGPRNYVLTERMPSTRTGTRITVRLRKKLGVSLTEMIRKLCVFVEFPIEVDELGRSETVSSNPHDLPPLCWPDPVDPNAEFRREFYPINRCGLEGGFCVVTRTVSGRTRWISSSDNVKVGSPVYLEDEALLALNGIRVPEDPSDGFRHFRGGILCPRVDVRRESAVQLSRSGGVDVQDLPDVRSRIEEILTAHLGASDERFDLEGWRYRNHLAYWSRELLTYWRCRSDMVPYYRDGHLQQCSLDALLRQCSFFLPAAPEPYEGRPFLDESAISRALPLEASVLHSEMSNSDALWGVLHSEVEPCAVWIGPSGTPVAELRNPSTPGRRWGDRVCLLPIAKASFEIVGFGTRGSWWVVINTESEFGRWWRDVERAHCDGENGLHSWPVFSKSMASAVRYRDRSARALIKTWNGTSVIPARLRCPIEDPRVYRRQWR